MLTTTVGSLAEIKNLTMKSRYTQRQLERV